MRCVRVRVCVVVGCGSRCLVCVQVHQRVQAFTTSVVSSLRA